MGQFVPRGRGKTLVNAVNEKEAFVILPVSLFAGNSYKMLLVKWNERAPVYNRCDRVDLKIFH